MVTRKYFKVTGMQSGELFPNTSFYAWYAYDKESFIDEMLDWKWFTISECVELSHEDWIKHHEENN